jgi:hypothetical protein
MSKIYFFYHHQTTSTHKRRVISVNLMFMVSYMLVMYILKVQRDAHGFVLIIYLNMFALHVSGAICTHHQEHKLQITAVGTCDLWMTKVLDSMKRFRFI